MAAAAAPLPAAVPVRSVSTSISIKESASSSDLAELLKEFPGEYDNYAQWEFDAEHNVSSDEQHAHLHSIFYGPVDLPQLGEHIFYVQQYLDGIPTNIYRQRLYSFSESPTVQGEIVLSFFDFKNGSKYVDAQKDPSKLKGLTRNDVTQVTDACDVYWKRDADGIFRGKTTEDCIVIDHITGSSIRIEDNTELGPDYVSIHERGFDVKTGAKIFGNPTPDVLNRTDREARLFNGYVAVETSPGEVWAHGQRVDLGCRPNRASRD